jgi:predicted nuclease of predicted toxin-antitoxin system
MNLYLDDDSIDPLLVRLLRQAGHDVRLPADLGLSGALDAVHFKQAIHESRVVLSRNHDDFKALHQLILESQGRHPGLLIVRFDNNPKRDLTSPGVVRALHKLIAANYQLSNQMEILNFWR